MPAIEINNGAQNQKYKSSMLLRTQNRDYLAPSLAVIIQYVGCVS